MATCLPIIGIYLSPATAALRRMCVVNEKFVISILHVAIGQHMIFDSNYTI